MLSFHRPFSWIRLVCVHFLSYRLLERNIHLKRTHSFAIRTGQAKKAWDSNETLKERRGDRRNMDEYLDSIKAVGKKTLMALGLVFSG